ncbi:hypothetical protein [Streptomyces sp. 8N706]|uniref:hypothetical protein n=1 Tax=Streptomyces sp. 8N706 TaxID=3457416 RepID=UPI003FD64B81
MSNERGGGQPPITTVRKVVAAVARIVGTSAISYAEKSSGTAMTPRPPMIFDTYAWNADTRRVP